MSANETGDEHQRDFEREGKSGLSLPRNETGGRATGPRGRRAAGMYDKLKQASGAGDGTPARWLVPAAAVIVVLLVVDIAMYFSQSNELAAWKSEIAALRERVAASGSNDLGPEVDRIAARLEGLSTRVEASQETSAAVEALRADLTRQNEQIEALAARVDEFEKSASQPGGGAETSDTDTSDTGASDAQPSGSAGEQDGGAWAINLITVSDRASAESVRNTLQEKGVDSRIEPVTRDGNTLLRVVVPGFASRAEASDAVPGLKESLGLPGDPWISRQ